MTRHLVLPPVAPVLNLCGGVYDPRSNKKNELKEQYVDCLFNKTS